MAEVEKTGGSLQSLANAALLILKDLGIVVKIIF
jgi:hypothetical protein